MTKVYPNGVSGAGNSVAGCSEEEERQLLIKSSLDASTSAVQLTVWKKSLLFNCDGFTVFDAMGNLFYRVDNYVAAGNRADIVLMDASGTSLLTIRRKRLSLGDNWMVFKGETAANPVFTARKHMNLLNGKSLAHVSSNSSPAFADCTSTSETWPQQQNKKKKMQIMYEIEGSYTQRCCVVYDHKRRRRVAEIRRKEATVGGISLGLDVFRLVILQPNEMDSAVAMALVILLDQMFGPSSTTSR